MNSTRGEDRRSLHSLHRCTRSAICAICRRPLSGTGPLLLRLLCLPSLPPYHLSLPLSPPLPPRRPYTGPGHTASALTDFSEGAMAGGAYNRLWDSFLPPKCLAAHSSDPGACLLPSLSYGFVDAPLFIIEAQVPVHPDSLVPMICRCICSCM